MNKRIAVQFIRFPECNVFDGLPCDVGATVNTQLNFSFPLLFSGHLFTAVMFREEMQLYPKFACFFYGQLKGNCIFDLSRFGVAKPSFLNDLVALLKDVKTTLTKSDLTDEQRSVANRFKCRFIVAIASVFDNWAGAQQHFESFDSPQEDRELSWYENVYLYKQFNSPFRKCFSQADAEHWMRRIQFLEPQYSKKAMLFGFLNIYRDKMSTVPSVDFLKDNFGSFLSSIEIEGTFSQVANRIIKESLNNPLMMSVDDLSFRLNFKDRSPKRLMVCFEHENILGKTSPFYFDVSNYGERSSLVAFFAQFQLPHLCLKIPDHPDLIGAQNFQFRNDFFQGMLDRRWINSSGELVFPLDQQALKSFFVDVLYTAPS